MPLFRLRPGSKQPVRRADGGTGRQVRLAAWLVRVRVLEPLSPSLGEPHALPLLPTPTRSLLKAGGLDCCRYAAHLFAAFGPGFEGYR